MTHENQGDAMKHITEASDEELGNAIIGVEAQDIVLAIRTAFDFSPTVHLNNSTADLIKDQDLWDVDAWDVMGKGLITSRALVGLPARHRIVDRIAAVLSPPQPAERYSDTVAKAGPWPERTFDSIRSPQPTEALSELIAVCAGCGEMIVRNPQWFHEGNREVLCDREFSGGEATPALSGAAILNWWAEHKNDNCTCGHERRFHRDDRRNACSKCRADGCHEGFIEGNI